MSLALSIIIPVKEINDYLRKETIPALLKQNYRNFEILILPDHKSSEKFDKTRIIPTYPKTGPADKRDRGAKEARGGILAFLDDDSYPDSDWLKNALAIFEGKEKGQIAAVCGPAITPLNDNLKCKVSGYVWSSWLGSGGAGTYRCAISPRKEVDDYPSVNLLVRKKDFLAVGGFDSHFWPGEDTKLCLDLTKKLGKKIIYDPSVLVYHHRRAVFGPHLQQISRYAIHRGHFARVLPITSFRLGYLVPTFFALGLIGGPILILVLKILQLPATPLILLYLFSIFLYLAVLLITASSVYLKEKDSKLALLFIPSVFVTHFVYGILFVKGFFSKDLPR